MSTNKPSIGPVVLEIAPLILRNFWEIKFFYINSSMESSQIGYSARLLLLINQLYSSTFIFKLNIMQSQKVNELTTLNRNHLTYFDEQS